MEINRNNVIEIVQKSGLKPDKDYGQNYLLEPSICEKIVDALNISKEDAVLEIGPGLGSLTHFISLHEEAMIIFMGFSLVSALGVYWLVGALFSIAQTLITHAITERKNHKKK